MNPVNPEEFRNKKMAEGNEDIPHPHAGLSKEARSIAGPKIIAEHKVLDTDTLSGIALKYYGSAAEKLWRHIYEFNKAVIGANPGMLKPGVVLRVPEKPED